MEFTIKETFASRELIQQEIEKQLNSQGYKTIDYYGTVVESEPMKIENITQGFLFKKTYHKWFWKVISKVRLEAEKTVMGKYQLFIELPYSDATFQDVNTFIEGLKERLGDLKESMEIIFVKVPDFGTTETNNIPIVWY